MSLWQRFRLWRLQREVAHWEYDHRYLLRRQRAVEDALRHADARRREAQETIVSILEVK